MGPRQREVRFHDRTEAGRMLAAALADAGYQGRDDVVVLALPRGGLPVAFEVAAGLGAPLDVFLVRKLGVPGHEELAMGAIASGGTVVLNRDVVGTLGITRDTVQRVVEQERTELARREHEYREGRPPPDLAGRTVIVVDDGLATGSSMRAAVAALRALGEGGPAAVVVAVPVAPAATCAELADEPGVDRVVCPATPEPFMAVGMAYSDFRQVGDDEVRSFLRRSIERDLPSC